MAPLPASLALPKHANELFDEGPKLAHRISDWWNINTKLSGKWTTSEVAFDIKTYAGSVTGEIVSEGLKENYVFSRIEVVGKSHGSNARLTVFDYIEGRKVGLAEIQLSHVVIDGKECLKAKVVTQAAKYFPSEFTLARASREISGGEWNQRQRERLLEAVKEWSKNKRDQDGKHRICEPNCDQ